MTVERNQFWPLLARLLIGTIFVLSGINKIVAFDQVAGYMAAHGVPAARAALVVVTIVELVGGLSLVLGIATSAGALLLFLYLIPVTLVMHGFWDYRGIQRQMQLIEFLKNLAIMGGLIYAALYGAGALSIDGWLARHGRHIPFRRVPAL